MKTKTKTFSICITALMFLLGFNSCSDDGHEAIKPFPNEPDGENNIEILLTDNLIKQWRLVNIFDIDNNSIPASTWSECEKSEILTFNTDKSFSISCSGNGLSLFTWNVREMEGETLLNLVAVKDSDAPAIWVNNRVSIQLLTEDLLIIEINGIKHEYIPFFLENSDPREYQ